jgi:hypothetical protein
MLEDNEFERISDFLKSQENAEMQFLMNFDNEVSKHIKDTYDLSNENAKENFVLLHSSLMQNFSKFNETQDEALKYFSSSLVLIKNILESLSKVQQTSIMEESEKSIYLALMDSLTASLKEEVNTNISFYKAFLEYIDNFITPIHIEN